MGRPPIYKSEEERLAARRAAGRARVQRHRSIRRMQHEAERKRREALNDDSNVILIDEPYGSSVLAQTDEPSTVEPSALNGADAEQDAGADAVSEEQK